MSIPHQAGLNFQYRTCGEISPGDVTGPLPEDEVHIWQAALPAPVHAEADFFQLLSADEKERAARVRFENLRNEFVYTRAMLRILLGGYLGIAAADLRFAYSEHGKPALNSHSGSQLSFNLSDTDGAVVYAFARRRRIGIDVEKVRHDFDVEPIAERFFSLAEFLALRELPAEQRHRAFFRCWTCKEAYIKAIGEGLSHPLHQFDVAVSAEREAALLSTRPDPGEAGRWILRDIAVGEGHVAALAVESTPSVAVG